LNRVVKLLASMMGVGYIPVAPATAASAVTALLVCFLGTPSSAGYLIIVPILYLSGVYISGRAEAEWGRDSGRIVIDEVMGFFVAISFLSIKDMGGPWGGLVLAFFLFRFYDIVKPFPVDSSQRLPAGWGVMTDDLLAGIYTNLTLRVLHWIFWAT